MLTEQDIAEAKRALKELADEAQGNGNSEGWIAAQERPIRAVIAAHEAKAAPAVPEKLPSGMATGQAGGKWRVTLEFDAHSDAAALHDYMLRNGVPSKSMALAPAIPQDMRLVHLSLLQELESSMHALGQGFDFASVDSDRYSRLREAIAAPSQEPAVPQGLPLHRCTNCQAIYQDQPPTQCDCMPDKQEYEVGFASFPKTPAAPSQPVTLTDRQFDLICQAIDKADTITMEGDYMLDSDDCIGVVRVMQALFSIAALREKE